MNPNRANVYNTIPIPELETEIQIQIQYKELNPILIRLLEPDNESKTFRVNKYKYTRKIFLCLTMLFVSIIALNVYLNVYFNYNINTSLNYQFTIITIIISIKTYLYTLAYNAIDYYENVDINVVSSNLLMSYILYWLSTVLNYLLDFIFANVFVWILISTITPTTSLEQCIMVFIVILYKAFYEVFCSIASVKN